MTTAVLATNYPPRRRLTVSYEGPALWHVIKHRQLRQERR